MPQTLPKRCLIACLLNRYVAALSSGVLSLNLSMGTNHRSEPLRWHIEQLQAIALSISPSTSKATLPQWQLPLYVVIVHLRARMRAGQFSVAGGAVKRDGVGSR